MQHIQSQRNTEICEDKHVWICWCLSRVREIICKTWELFSKDLKQRGAKLVWYFINMRVISSVHFELGLKNWGKVFLVHSLVKEEPLGRCAEMLECLVWGKSSISCVSLQGSEMGLGIRSLLLDIVNIERIYSWIRDKGCSKLVWCSDISVNVPFLPWCRWSLLQVTALETSCHGIMSPASVTT